MGIKCVINAPKCAFCILLLRILLIAEAISAVSQVTGWCTCSINPVPTSLRRTPESPNWHQARATKQGHKRTTSISISMAQTSDNLVAPPSVQNWRQVSAEEAGRYLPICTKRMARALPQLRQAAHEGLRRITISPAWKFAPPTVGL